MAANPPRTARCGTFLFTLLVCAGILCPALCHASETAFALVAQAMRAKLSRTCMARQDIVWALPASLGGSMMEIVTQTARAGRQSQTTYLFPPDAAGRIMTDDGAQTSLYEPQKRTLLLEPSAAREMAQDLPAMLTLLRRNYDCRLVRRERVNDQDCAVVAICSRTPGGPYKLLWISLSHPYVLRLEQHDADGSRVYVSSYDAIVFPARLPPGALALPPGAKMAAHRLVQAVEFPRDAGAAKACAAAGLAPLLPAWVPQGYALLRVSLLTQPATGEKMVQMRYSDGLQTLTVLQSPAEDTLPPPLLLNATLARYGQQAWAQDTGRVRTIVRGDLSLPDAVGQEMRLALSPLSALRLQHGLAQDFGPAAKGEAQELRRGGWDYAQIAALQIYQQAHPKDRAGIERLRAKKCAWPEIARHFHANATDLDTRARLWIAGTLSL